MYTVFCWKKREIIHPVENVKREKLPEEINVSDKETYQIKKWQIAGYKQ